MTTPTATIFGITYDETVALRDFMDSLDEARPVWDALPWTVTWALACVDHATWPDRDITTLAEYDARQRELYPDEEDE